MKKSCYYIIFQNNSKFVAKDFQKFKDYVNTHNYNLILIHDERGFKFRVDKIPIIINSYE